MAPVQRSLVWLLGLGLVGLFLGCNEASVPPTPGGPPAAGLPPEPVTSGKFDTESGPFAAGKKVVVASGCFRCHTIDGVRGPVGGGGMGGPPGGPGGGGPPMAGGPPGPGGGPPGPGGRGPMMGRSRAPDLGQVGRDPRHTVEWFMEYVADPGSVKPDARMPPFGDKIQETDLRALAQYLASLK